MALDLALDRPVPVAVADLDVALRHRLVDLDALTNLVHSRSDRGIVDARRAVGLVDPSAESRPESQVRVHLVLARDRPAVRDPPQDGGNRTGGTRGSAMTRPQGSMRPNRGARDGHKDP
jgi:hypothetical protein